MPNATRNTKANSGNDGSALAKWNTWLNTNAHTPSVAMNESTTVAMRITGAISARSTTANTSRITSRMIGMISARSCREASCTSRLTADWPPTSASAPSMWDTAERSFRMVSYAGCVS